MYKINVDVYALGDGEEAGVLVKAKHIGGVVDDNYRCIALSHQRHRLHYNYLIRDKQINASINTMRNRIKILKIYMMYIYSPSLMMKKMKVQSLRETNRNASITLCR